MTKYFGCLLGKITIPPMAPGQAFNHPYTTTQRYKATMAHWSMAGGYVARRARRRQPLYGAMTVLWLLLSVTAGHAQHERWETVTTAGVQAFDQGHYGEAAQRFQAALAIAETLTPDDPRRPTSLMNLAAAYLAQGQYPQAERLYQQTLLLQEQLLGPEDLQLVEVLQAYAALHRTMHPWQSLLPWSTASKLTARARRIQIREESAGLVNLPVSGVSPESDIFRPSE
jgi:tetratricopeptide (TPR) repeat protein